MATMVDLVLTYYDKTYAYTMTSVTAGRLTVPVPAADTDGATNAALVLAAAAALPPTAS